MLDIILFSGGSGTRLWPLSNVVRAKQDCLSLIGIEATYLPSQYGYILKNNDGDSSLAKMLIVYKDKHISYQNTRNAVKAKTDLEIIKVQIGDEFIEDDIERIDYLW